MADPPPVGCSQWWWRDLGYVFEQGEEEETVSLAVEQEVLLLALVLGGILAGTERRVQESLLVVLFAGCSLERDTG